MKTFSPLQRTLIQLLSDKAYHSGSALGKTLGVSRTAIWKHINQLKALGLCIHIHPQKGYCCTEPLDILDETVIREALTAEGFDYPTTFHMFTTVDSTNQFLKNRSSSSALEVCCAETQTQGRGRFGRNWESPFAKNIYCSSRWHFDLDLSRLSGLSLVISLATLAALQNMGVESDIRIKWPNDILWHDKKLSGNLIEVVGESNSNVDVIIGIGLNVNVLDAKWASLLEITGAHTNRNGLIAKLLIQLHAHIMQFTAQGFEAFLPRWREVDYLQGRSIQVSQPKTHLFGKADGVNEEGQLILIDNNDQRHYLSSGDTSLRQKAIYP